MSSLIRCDKCRKTMYADSRSNKGDWCTVRIDYVDGLSTLHLCKVCHRQFLVEFVRTMKPEEYDDQFGSWWEDEVIDKDGDTTIVTNIHERLFDGLCSDGSTMSDLFLEDVRKTGRHYDHIGKLLEAIRA